MKGRGFMFQKNGKIKALYNDDLEMILERIGLLEEFKKRQIRCMYCGDLIERANLYALVPTGDIIQMCCNKPECVLKLSGEAQ